MFNFIKNIDNAAEIYINSLSDPAWLNFFHIVTLFGGFFIVAIVCSLVVWFLWSKKPVLIKYFIPALLINEALVYLIKNLAGRLRPFGALKYQEYDGSMPSGHSAIAFFLYGYVCYLIVRFYPAGWKRNIAVLSLVVLILLIGFSRLYMNVHYLSDVLAGFLLGGITLFQLIKISNQRRVK